MRTETWGGLRVRISGGSDGAGGGAGPVVVLMHGYGASGDDLVPLMDELEVPAGTRFVFPAAPIALAMGPWESRAWWHIDMAALEEAIARGRQRDLTTTVPEGLSAANDAIERLLGEIERELKPSHIVLGGFSQGAMLALNVALMSQRNFAGLVLLSGTLIAEQLWTQKLAARKGLKVLQSHGVRDPILSFAVSERLRDLMTEHGLQVEFHRFHGAHEIPMSVLLATSDFLKRVLAD